MNNDVGLKENAPNKSQYPWLRAVRFSLLGSLASVFIALSGMPVGPVSYTHLRAHET